MTKNARRFIFIATATMFVAAVVSVAEAISPEMVPDAFFIVVGIVLASANVLYKMNEENAAENRHQQTTIKLGIALITCVLTATFLLLAFGITAAIPIFTVSAFLVGAMSSHLRPQFE